MVCCFMGKFPIHASPVRLESLSSKIFFGVLPCMALSFLFDFMSPSAFYYLGSLFLGRRQGSWVGQREAPPSPPLSKIRLHLGGANYEQPQQKQ